MTTNPVVVGVDVAKDRLDVAVRPSGETWSNSQKAKRRPRCCFSYYSNRVRHSLWISPRTIWITDLSAKASCRRFVTENNGDSLFLLLTMPTFPFWEMLK